MVPADSEWPVDPSPSRRMTGEKRRGTGDGDGDGEDAENTENAFFHTKDNEA